MAAAGEEYDGGNTTGFLSPAGDAFEGVVDLVKDILDLRRPSRYAVRVYGDALRGRGILSGDILVADSDLPPRSGRVCVAFLHGDVLVATLTYRRGEWWLRPSDDAREPVVVRGEPAEVWAVVCGLVRKDV
jgi:DNA polymerase V